MSDHDTIQTQLLEGIHTDELDEHLATCDECVRLGEEVAQVRRHAPELGDGPPADLADRVLEHVRAESGISGRPGASVLAIPDRFRRSIHRSLAVAAAVLLLVGAVAVLNQGSDDEPLDVLLASAQRTEDAGPAEARVEGRATVTVATPEDPGQRPDLSAVPAELHDHVQDRFAEVMARWEQQMAEFEARVNATLESADRLIEEQMERLNEQFGGGPGSPPPPPPPPGDGPEPSGQGGAEEPPPPPGDLSLGFDISAMGQIHPGQAIQLHGGVASGGGGRSDFEVRGRTDATGVLVAGSWQAAAQAGSLLNTVLTRTDGAPSVLRAAVDAELVGETEIDGVTVRHYRFTVDPELLAGERGPHASGGAGTWMAEAWIDGDDLLRRLDVNAAGSFDPAGAAGWATDLRLELSGFGSVAQLEVDGPPADVTVEGSSSASVFGPFTPALAASLRGEAAEAG